MKKNDIVRIVDNPGAELVNYLAGFELNDSSIGKLLTNKSKTGDYKVDFGTVKLTLFEDEIKLLHNLIFKKKDKNGHALTKIFL